MQDVEGAIEEELEQLYSPLDISSQNRRDHHESANGAAGDGARVVDRVRARASRRGEEKKREDVRQYISN